MASPLLAVEHVRVQIGGLVALSDLSFTVEQGQVVSLIGPNGAGKTTAFNAITGYLKPRQGTVAFEGRSILGLSPEHIARLGLVRSFQRTSIFGACTVFENALMALHMRGRSGLVGAILSLPSRRREEVRLREEAAAILDFVDLGPRADVRADALAYGEQRRLGIALAAAAAPRLLLLDEPAAGLNPSETAECMVLIRRLRDKGTTILLVEHDMAMVMGISDRIVVLNQGRIIADGRPDAILRDPEVIKAYLGGTPPDAANAGAQHAAA